MSAPYRDLPWQIRLAFPQPVSDRIHDSYFVFSLMRAIDQIDALKSEIPLLGGSRTLDYTAARQARMASDPSSVEQVTEELVAQFPGTPDLGTSAGADARDQLLLDRQHHRGATAGDLQPQSRLRHTARGSWRRRSG